MEDDMATSLKFVQTISAPAVLVYRAFTNATALREWLCDKATVDPKPGGHFFVGWNNGYYACGEYVKVNPEREVSFIWNGRDDPEPTTVNIYITALDNGSTTLSLEQTGLDNTPQWAKAYEEISNGWNLGLKNLVSVLESGPDLRIVTRPMLGVVFGDFNKKKAEELKVPVDTGLRLDSLVEGLGAQKAGLKKDDVIVSLNGKPTPDFAAILTIIQSLQAGDHVDVGFYRGPEKKRADMELSRRPMPEIPPNTVAFGEAVKKINLKADSLLEEALQGVSESEGDFKPAPNEWSIKEILAHLIHGERDTQSYISEYVFSQERVADGYGDNLPARISATVHAYQTISSLLEELKRGEEETVYIVSHLPAEFVANKGSYWKLAFNMLQLPIHTQEHVAQIKANLAAARAK